MQGARSAEAGMYKLVHADFEHRATPQTPSAAIFRKLLSRQRAGSSPASVQQSPSSRPAQNSASAAPESGSGAHLLEPAGMRFSPPRRPSGMRSISASSPSRAPGPATWITSPPQHDIDLPLHHHIHDIAQSAAFEDGHASDEVDSIGLVPE